MFARTLVSWKRRLWALCLLVGLALPSVGVAQTTHIWTGPDSGGAFEASFHWKPEFPFDPGDTCYVGPGHSVNWKGENFRIDYGRIVHVEGSSLHVTNIPPGRILEIGTCHAGSPWCAHEAELSLQSGASLYVSDFPNRPDLLIGRDGMGSVSVTGGSSISGNNDLGIFGNIWLGQADETQKGTGRLTIADAPGGGPGPAARWRGRAIPDPG